MPKKRTLMDLGTPESDAEFDYPEPKQFEPYRPDFQFGFEPQSYASDVPVAPPPEASQFVTPKMPFQLPTFGGSIGLPLGRLGELQLRGDFTRYPESPRPDFSIGFGFTRKF